MGVAHSRPASRCLQYGIASNGKLGEDLGTRGTQEVEELQCTIVNTKRRVRMGGGGLGTRLTESEFLISYQKFIIV